MKRIFFLLTALLLAVKVQAAVTVDATNSGAGNDPLSVSHTVASGATLALMLCVVDSSTNAITGVTRSTDTYSNLRQDTDGATGAISSIWYVVNPVVGTANAVASISGVTDGVGCWVISVFGSDTSTPFSDDDGIVDGSADTSESLTLTAVSGELIVDILGISVATTTSLTAGDDQTDVVSVEDSGVGHGYGGSYQLGSVAGGVMSWSWTNNGATAYSAAVIKAAPDAAFGPLRRRNQ